MKQSAPRIRDKSLPFLNAHFDADRTERLRERAEIEHYNALHDPDWPARRAAEIIAEADAKFTPAWDAAMARFDAAKQGKSA